MDNPFAALERLNSESDLLGNISFSDIVDTLSLPLQKAQSVFRTSSS